MAMTAASLRRREEAFINSFVNEMYFFMIVLIIKGLNEKTNSSKRGGRVRLTRSQRWEESIHYLKLAIVLVAVFEGDGDHIRACAVDVGDKTVGSPDLAVIDRSA